MTRTPETSAAQKRFQFGLRSLLIFTAALALWCSLMKVNPPLGIAMAVFVPFLALGRWLMRNSQTRTGMGCIGSIFLTIMPWAILASINADEELPSLFAVLILACLTGCGLVGLFVCFCALVPFMAQREDRLSHSEEPIGTVQDGESRRHKLTTDRNSLPLNDQI